MKPIKLIIFDCDGVLINSELIIHSIYSKFLASECNISLSLEETLDIFLGHTPEECRYIIKKMLGGSPPPSSFEERYHIAVKQALKSHLKPIRGIELFLEKTSIPFCVASNSKHSKILDNLALTGLSRYFRNNIFSSEDVQRGKPFPDVYLHAANQMGMPAARNCLVIEDSPIGVKAGVAAGMTVFGFSEYTCAKKLFQAGAHHTFDNMCTLTQEINFFLELSPNA